MTVGVFADTNVRVQARDRTDEAKHGRALDVLGRR